MHPLQVSEFGVFLKCICPFQSAECIRHAASSKGVLLRLMRPPPGSCTVWEYPLGEFCRVHELHTVILRVPRGFALCLPLLQPSAWALPVSGLVLSLRCCLSGSNRIHAWRLPNPCTLVRDPRMVLAQRGDEAVSAASLANSANCLLSMSPRGPGCPCLTPGANTLPVSFHAYGSLETIANDTNAAQKSPPLQHLPLPCALVAATFLCCAANVQLGVWRSAPLVFRFCCHLAHSCRLCSAILAPLQCSRLQRRTPPLGGAAAQQSSINALLLVMDESFPQRWSTKTLYCHQTRPCRKDVQNHGVQSVSCGHPLFVYYDDDTGQPWHCSRLAAPVGRPLALPCPAGKLTPFAVRVSTPVRILFAACSKGRGFAAGSILAGPESQPCLCPRLGGCVIPATAVSPASCIFASSALFQRGWVIPVFARCSMPTKLLCVMRPRPNIPAAQWCNI